MADGKCGRAQNDPSIIAYKKIVHHDDGNVGKQKNRMMALQLLFARKRKRMMIMMVKVSFGFITNYYK